MSIVHVPSIIQKRANLLLQPPFAWALAWGLLAIAWLYVAWVPVTIASQALLAWSVVAVLLVLKRFAERAALLRLLFLCLAALVTARYILWRATSTLPI